MGLKGFGWGGCGLVDELNEWSFELCIHIYE
jgi:hypothetical protein